MRKKFLLKRIESKVSFEPDFNKIKDQINVTQYRKSTNIYNLKFIPIVLLLVIMISVSVLKITKTIEPTPDYTKNEVQINSEEGISDFISYLVEIPKKRYTYEEVISVKFQINQKAWMLGDNKAIQDGDLCIKLEDTEHFEVIGKREYIFNNVQSDDAEDWPLEGEFKIKAIKENLVPEKLKMKIKFNMSDVTRQKLETGLLNCHWIDLSEEYFYTRTLIEYMIDQKEVIIIEKKDDGAPFFERINQQYLNNQLTKQEYVNKIIDYWFNLSDNKVCVSISENNVLNYYSKNFIAKIKIFENEEVSKYFMYLWEQRNQGNASLIDKLMATTIVDIIYDNEIISEEMYKQEIALIEENGASVLNTVGMEFIIIDDWQDYLYDYNNNI